MLAVYGIIPCVFIVCTRERQSPLSPDIQVRFSEWQAPAQIFDLYYIVIHILLADIITCLALDNCGSYLVTGSRDCTCIIWSIQGAHGPGSGAASSNIPVHALTSQTNLQSIMQLNTQNSFSPKPLTTLYGHDDSISSVAIYTELDVVVSGSLVCLLSVILCHLLL